MCKYEIATLRLLKVIIWQTYIHTESTKLYIVPLCGWSNIFRGQKSKSNITKIYISSRVHHNRYSYQVTSISDHTYTHTNRQKNISFTQRSWHHRGSTGPIEYIPEQLISQYCHQWLFCSEMPHYWRVLIRV